MSRGVWGYSAMNNALLVVVEASMRSYSSDETLYPTGGYSLTAEGEI